MTDTAAVSSRRNLAVLRASTLRSLRFAKGAPALAAVVCIAVIGLALFGPFVAPYAPDHADFLAPLAPPAWDDNGSSAHWLGTDQLGRDILSRVIAGARISMLTAAAAIFVAGTLGTAIGLVAGYVGGIVDTILMRIVDAFLALPFILMALALVAALGSGVGNLILVMTLTNWARYARLMRSEAMSLRQRDFVTLARIAGVRARTIMTRHILPNALNSVSVLALLDVGRSIVLESSLSFLGLGIQPPDVSWGLMLADGKAYMAFAWWVTTLPGVMIVATVMSFNAIGDWLKARFDPRSEL
jgi:peptide/nickel transport system permease protein